nr:hypothetical protein [Pandoravirus massiliensis]
MDTICVGQKVGAFFRARNRGKKDTENGGMPTQRTDPSGAYARAESTASLALAIDAEIYAWKAEMTRRIIALRQEIAVTAALAGLSLDPDMDGPARADGDLYDARDL